MSTTPPSPDAGETLDPRDELIATLLAAGRTEVEAAAELNVSRATIQRAMRRPEVRELARQIRTAAAAVANGLLIAETRDAVARLVELSRCGGREDAVKLRATVALIELAQRGAELLDLADEVRELRVLFDQRRAAGDDTQPAPPTT